MSTHPKCPTATDALVQALAKAVEPVVAGRTDGQLGNVSFGRFAAEGQGWYWQLDIITEYRSYPAHRSSEDTIERRIRMIIEKWKLDVGKYEEQEGAGE